MASLDHSELIDYTVVICCVPTRVYHGDCGRLIINYSCVSIKLGVLDKPFLV